MRYVSWSSLVLAAGLLAGCFPRGDPSQPIPTARIDAPQPARRLVVVLPGRGDDLDGLRRSGIAQAVQSAWPDADVVLTGLALGYYMAGQAERRLHDEVVAPARRKGYAQVWLVGASLGGMGAILFDRAHPGLVDGMVLLAPYMGDTPMVSRIVKAGGVANWQPPPPPREINGENFQQELWRQVKGWSREPAQARRVWLAWGKRDRFADTLAWLAPVLPAGQVLVRDGGHDWKLWSPVTRDVLLQVDRRGG